MTLSVRSCQWGHITSSNTTVTMPERLVWVLEVTRMFINYETITKQSMLLSKQQPPFVINLPSVVHNYIIQQSTKLSCCRVCHAKSLVAIFAVTLESQPIALFHQRCCFLSRRKSIFPNYVDNCRLWKYIFHSVIIEDPQTVP